MKKLLIIGSALLTSILLAGTAYSVEEPSQTVVFPLICEVVTTSVNAKGGQPEHLDMIFTLANVTNIGTSVYANVYNFQSQRLYDEYVNLSPYDISKRSCYGLIDNMTEAQKSAMIKTIRGKQYYLGYIRYDVVATGSGAPGASLIGWGEMRTLSQLGKSVHLYTDTGFNGVPDFYDNVNAATTTTDMFGHILKINTNQRLMMRYDITNPDSYNLWIIMTPSDVPVMTNAPCSREMKGFICDENEHCFDIDISLPYQVNVIDPNGYVGYYLYPTPTWGFPRRGFGMFDVVLDPNISSANACGNAANEQYLGWSYMYSQGKYNLNTALIFPMHRQINWPVAQ